MRILHILKDYDISGEETMETPLNHKNFEDETIHPSDEPMPNDAEQIAIDAQRKENKTPYHKPTLRKRNTGDDLPRKRKKISHEDLEFLRKNEHA